MKWNEIFLYILGWMLRNRGHCSKGWSKKSFPFQNASLWWTASMISSPQLEFTRLKLGHARIIWEFYIAIKHSFFFLMITLNNVPKHYGMKWNSIFLWSPKMAKSSGFSTRPISRHVFDVKSKTDTSLWQRRRHPVHPPRRIMSLDQRRYLLTA